MPDLHAAIRERLDARPILTSDEAARAADVNRWVTAAHAALLVVLDWHQPMPIGWGDDETYLCGACRYFTSEWPCPTLDAIAEKLGIET